MRKVSTTFLIAAKEVANITIRFCLQNISKMHRVEFHKSKHEMDKSCNQTFSHNASSLLLMQMFSEN